MAAGYVQLYQRVWKKRHISLKQKGQIYRTIVTPSLMYGCETWVWTSDQMKKLEGTQYRFLRTIAGKTWKDKKSYVDLINSFEYMNETLIGRTQQTKELPSLLWKRIVDWPG